MYLWLAINLDEQLSDVRVKAEKIEQSIAPQNSAFTLPMHVSLKISFFLPDEDYDAAHVAISEYFKTIAPFDIETDGIERENSIVWIRMKKNESLNRIHCDLDNLMAEKFGVVQHPFDMDFKFHTTLFIDADLDKVNAAYQALNSLSIPSNLRAKTFIIGSSETGEIGTYKARENIDIH